MAEDKEVYVCTPELVREHERRITQNTENNEHLSSRVDSVITLVNEFTVEMRESNKNISELVTSVKVLTGEISHVVKATDKHEDDIAEIKDNMETKDTVLKLYNKIEDSNAEYKRGQDVVMKSIREQKTTLEEHMNEPAKEALANQKALQKWLLVGFGSIILTVVTTAVVMIVFG